MKNILNAVMKMLGYTPSPKLKVQAPAQKTTQKVATQAHVVNAQVRNTLQMARDFYAQRGDIIVSTDLNNYLLAFEDILLMSATDDGSVETAKLLGLTWKPNATSQG